MSDSQAAQPNSISDKLKAERIQSKLKAERVQGLLAEVPGWELDEGGGLLRIYEFPTIRAAALFVQLVAEIGEATGYVPDIDMRYSEVTVRAATNQNSGVTEDDFKLARVLDNRL